MVKRKWWWVSMLAAIMIIIAGILYFTGKEPLLEEEEEEEQDQPDMFQNYFTAITTRFSDNVPYDDGYRMTEFQKAVSRSNKLKSAQEVLPWVCRGPYNVAGRVRGLVVDPLDNTHKTWFACAVSGGIWKTTDAGKNWTNLTPNLPNLATTTIALAQSNPSILYAGTGEGFYGIGMVRGDGIFKSTDHGVSWQLLQSTSKNADFYYINKILVSPADPNIVVVATNTGILKSVNGGISWTKTYRSILRVEDMEADPTDFSILYAGENSYGVVKSTDGGDHWAVSSSGIGSCQRVELAVSPVNPSKVFACMEADSNKTRVYISADKGASWKRFSNSGTNFADYLADQGWYDNTIACHPYNENVLLIGGVYLGKYTFSNTYSEGTAQVIRVDTLKTAPFLSFVNFGGSFLNGGMETGDKNNATFLSATDWSSVEIRFGNGRHQKAHRFTVPKTSGTNGDGGAGVPASQYEYQDYIDVPFEVWDTKNNRQLMASFRDQERDGTFNLIHRDPNNSVTGREYLYVNAVPYSELPDTGIARNGGQLKKQLYFFWPTLADQATWDPLNLPDSKISVEYGKPQLQLGTAAIISDGKGDQGGLNINLHVDHHNLVLVPVDASTQKFWIIDSNDGGVGLSDNSGDTFTQLTNGMISTQFYGVDKKTGADEFIGGMQDNGTWQSPAGTSASVTSPYNRRLGGDGFEVVWHPTKPNQIIGSVYNNKFYLSLDGGTTWNTANKGINDDGPFVTRIGYSPSNPDVLFAVGKNGVWRSKTFGYYGALSSGWEKITIGTGWTNTGDVTSQHNVKVSLANPNIIWAGAGMYSSPALYLFVSTDGGNSFSPVSVYNEVKMGYISGLATHPVNPNEAFALFSFNKAPKIVRTMDLGKTWQDISGFGTKDSSNNGFPNVAVHCLLVMPFDTSRIWVGTDIGLFESRDNGQTWAYANNGLPAVSIWQMKTVDNQVVVATHGRGIWTTTIPGSKLANPKSEAESSELRIYPVPAINSVNLELKNAFKGKLYVRVVSLQGKAMFSKEFTKSNAYFNEQIDLSALPEGEFILSLELGGNRISKKIVLSR